MATPGEISGITVGYGDYSNPAFFATLEPQLINAARAAADHAVSYRNFRVGACAAVLLPELDEVVFLEGANNSPYRGAPKDCAEMGIVRRAGQLAEQRRLTTNGVRILGMYVAGPSDPNLIIQVNGVATPTLHSCFDCQDLLRDHPAVTDATQIVTFALEGDHVEPERYSVADLLAFYRDTERPQVSAQLIAAEVLGASMLGSI